MLEGTIWQWPINSLNPANTNMYMFMVGQELPGRGKRELRAAVAEKDISLAQTDVTIRTRQMVNEVKQAYAALFIARKATQMHLASVELLRQIADVSQAKYATGRISQQEPTEQSAAARPDRAPAPCPRPSTGAPTGAFGDRAGGSGARLGEAEYHARLSRCRLAIS